MKILIWGEIKPGGPYDIFRQLDYTKILKELKENYHAEIFNVGNKVWIQGIVSALNVDSNELFFYDPNESWEEINEKYDKIVYSAANMLGYEHKKLIKEVVELFRNSKIPIYVIAIGAQAKSYDDLSELAKGLKDEISEFTDCIYRTGGEIACRGYFTKELLDKVCTNSAVVTGCPSLFQNGSQLYIEKKADKLNPVLNGNLILNKKYFSIFPKSVYIDQDEWLKYTYDADFYQNDDLKKKLLQMLYDKGYSKTELFLSGRIKVFWDIPEWHRFLEDGDYNFSIGSRIHGNIMSLLSGIPAMVCAIDSRTREMAEFYHLPFYFPTADPIDIYKMYEEADYSRLNQTYNELFINYAAFLQKNGLVDRINEKNTFWGRENPINDLQSEGTRRYMLSLLKKKSVQSKVFSYTASKMRWLFARYKTVEKSVQEKY